MRVIYFVLCNFYLRRVISCLRCSCKKMSYDGSWLYVTVGCRPFGSFDRVLVDEGLMKNHNLAEI